MSAARKEDEGQKLIQEAQKLLETKSSFFKSIFGGSSATKEEAAETFVKAANCFKLAKSWSMAGEAFERAADTYQDISEMQYEAASKYGDAAKSYKNVDGMKAVAAYEKAITLYTDSARFQQCARMKKEIAEIYEGNRDVSEALEAYIAAADFYDMEDAKSNANSMRVKVANLSAEIGKYAEAADLFEQIAVVALESNLLKYGARAHLLRAGLCRLCLSDLIGAQRAVEQYGKMDSTFSSSREGRLLEAVVKTVEEGDVEAFTNHLYEYDSLSKLDEWQTSILLKIKNSIRADDDDLT